MVADQDPWLSLRTHLATRALALRPQLSVVTLRRICLYRNHTTSTTVTLTITGPSHQSAKQETLTHEQPI